MLTALDRNAPTFRVMDSHAIAARRTPVDRAIQLAYVVAYRLMCVYWGVRPRHKLGALVAVFHEGDVLLVRNSYLPYLSLPGGYVRKRETSREAAVRELAEEVGIMAGVDELEPGLEEKREWDGKRDGIEIFVLHLHGVRPRVRIDNREVVAAEWVGAERALTLDLFPPIRRLLERLTSK